MPKQFPIQLDYPHRRVQLNTVGISPGISYQLQKCKTKLLEDSLIIFISAGIKVGNNHTTIHKKAHHKHFES